MKPDNHKIGNELLDLERMAPEKRSEYERRIRQMMESELKPWQRVVVLILAIIGIGGVILWSYLAFRNICVPGQSFLKFLPSILFWVIWSTIAVYILATGRITRMLSNIVAGVIWAWVLFVFIGAILTMDRSANPALSIGIAMIALGWLIIGAVIVIANQVRQSALKSQEEVVRLQLQMSEMNEKLDKLIGK